MANQDNRSQKTRKPSKQKIKMASLERHQMDIQRILSISLAATNNLVEGLDLCLDASLQISGMDCGGIYLFDDKFENLNLVVHKGLSNDLVKEILSYDKDDINALLVQKGEALYTLGHEIGVPQSPAEQHEGLRAFASLPLFDKSKVLGCINIASHVFDEISPSSRIAVETIAAQAGSVIARLQAKKALQRSEEHLSSLMQNAEHYAVYRLRISASDPHGLAVVFVSPSIIDIMGVAHAKKFETWFDNVHPDDRERIETANLKAFETLEFNEVMKINHPQKSEHRWIHSIAKGMTSKNGDIQYVNGIIIDITERKRIEDALVAKEDELETKTQKLEEINIALNVLLKKREKDKLLLQEQVLSNIKKLTIPYLEKLKKSKLNETQKTLIEVIESSLNEIVSPFSLKLSSGSFGLTPAEIKVADLVRQGKGTKEVAAIRGLSHKTVERHRENIRHKLGLKNRKINLQSHLNSLT
jgi:PAS domain S-box-containing protein